MLLQNQRWIWYCYFSKREENCKYYSCPSKHFNVVSTSWSDVVSMLCNIEKPTSGFVSFSTLTRHWMLVGVQVITATTVETWSWYDFDMISWRHMDAVSLSYRHRIFTKNSTNKVVLKINSHNNDSCFVNFPKESVNNILYSTC